MSFPQDIDFVSTPTQQLTYIGENSIVRESGGRLWVLTSSDGVLYSDDGGQTWTADSPASFTYIGFIFFDSNENLVVVQIFDGSGHQDICRVFVRNKANGNWVHYDLAIPGQPDVGFSFGINACQTDDGYIHIIKTVTYQLSGFPNFKYTSAIIYWNFKDGVFSSVEGLTDYNSGIPGIYLDSVYIIPGATGTGSLKIIPYSGQLYIFWTRQSSSGDTYSLLYGIKSSNMDIAYASKPWLTGTSYSSSNPISCVVVGGLFYRCLIDHTSGTFVTDLGNGKWVQITSYQPITTLLSSSAYVPFIATAKSNANIYFVTKYSQGGVYYYKLFRNFVDITPSGWDLFVPLHMEVAENDDIILYGYEVIGIGSFTPIRATARISGVWQDFHIGSTNDFVAGHTYNFASLR